MALGLAHTTVSRRLKALEEKLGARLLERHGAHVTLTPDGQAALGEATRIEEAVRAITQRIQGADTRLSGEVRVLLSEGLANYWLIPRMSQFITNNTAVSINWNTVGALRAAAETEEKNLRGEIDIAIYWWRPTSVNVVARKLGNVHYSIFTVRAYVDRYGLPNSLEDLAVHRLLQFNGYELNRGLKPWNDLVTKLGASMRVGNTTAADGILRTGEYVTLLPDYAMNVGSDVLVRVPAELNITLELWLAYHADKRGIVRLRSVAAEIARLAKADRGIWLS